MKLALVTIASIVLFITALTAHSIGSPAAQNRPGVTLPEITVPSPRDTCTPGSTDTSEQAEASSPVIWDPMQSSPCVFNKETMSRSCGSGSCVYERWCSTCYPCSAWTLVSSSCSMCLTP